MSDDLSERIAQGEALQREGSEDEAIAFFATLVERHPRDARVQFAMAGAFDFAGREAEAVPHYQAARQLGLDGPELQRWFVQMGSTLRNVGEHDQACAVLAEGCALYPQDAAMRMFSALALTSANRRHEAVATLMRTLLAHADTPESQRFRRALTWYVEELESSPGSA